MPEKDLTIEEFQEILHKEVDQFVDLYKRNAAATPDLYPGVMSEDEWHEQHFAHITMGLEAP